MRIRESLEKFWDFITVHHQPLSVIGTAASAAMAIVVAVIGAVISIQIDANENRRASVERSIAVARHILQSKPVEELKQLRRYADFVATEVDRANLASNTVYESDRLGAEINGAVVDHILQDSSRAFSLKYNLRDTLKYVRVIYDCGAFEENENRRESPLCDNETLHILLKSEILESFFQFRYVLYCNEVSRTPREIPDGSETLIFEAVITDFLSRDGLDPKSGWHFFKTADEHQAAIDDGTIPEKYRQFSIIRESKCDIAAPLASLTDATVAALQGGFSQETRFTGLSVQPAESAPELGKLKGQPLPQLSPARHNSSR